jgi:hypothetical protein
MCILSATLLLQRLNSQLHSHRKLNVDAPSCLAVLLRRFVVICVYEFVIESRRECGKNLLIVPSHGIGQMFEKTIVLPLRKGPPTASAPKDVNSGCVAFLTYLPWMYTCSLFTNQKLPSSYKFNSSSFQLRVRKNASRLGCSCRRLLFKSNVMMWGSPQTTQSTHFPSPDRVVVVVVCLGTVVVGVGTGVGAGVGTRSETPANNKLRPPVLDDDVLITSNFNLHQDFST